MYKTSHSAEAFGWIDWRRAWNQSFNSILLSLPYKQFATGYGARLLELAAELVVVFRAEHACVRSSDEHAKQHRPGGRGPMLGLELAKHVPGVYYANFFGPTLTKFFGHGRLESCPAVIKRAVGDGWLLTTAEDPADWNEPGALNLKQQVRRHLGDRAFFDVAYPERSTIAPFYDFSRVRKGARPAGAKSRSAGQEFFAAPSDAREFVVKVLEWVGRLRTTLDRSDLLDFSPESLMIVDEYASTFDEDSVAVQRDFVLGAAAYFGEIVRRNLGGVWGISRDDPYMPAIVLESGDVEYPLVRVVKLLRGFDRLTDWYEFLARGGVQLLR